MERNTLYRADELAALWRPRTKAERQREEAEERVEFEETCRRAERKGNRALELMRTAPANGDALASDYEVGLRKKAEGVK